MIGLVGTLVDISPVLSITGTDMDFASDRSEESTLATSWRGLKVPGEQLREEALREETLTVGRGERCM